MAASTQCRACNEEAVEDGYCEGHSERIRRALEMDAVIPNAIEGEEQVIDGYVYIEINYPDGKGQWKPVHDRIMEQQLGRALKEDEFVVHKNGIGTDNRIANLELHFGTFYEPRDEVEGKVQEAIRALLDLAPSVLNGFVEDRTVEYLAALENEMNRIRGRLLGLIESFDLEPIQERAIKATLKTLTYDMQANLVEILDE